MNEPRFTPGKWEVDVDLDEINDDIEYVEIFNIDPRDPKGCVESICLKRDICTVSYYGYSTIESELGIKGLDRFKANIAIIRAAPAMYEMLDSLIDLLEYHHCIDTKQEVIELLKKARGEA